MSVREYLGYGEANAIHGDELAMMLNMSYRNLRKAVDQERIAGTPIISSEKGYYLPGEENGAQELKAFIATFECRRNTTNKVLRTARRSLKRIEEGEERNGKETGIYGI